MADTDEDGGDFMEPPPDGYVQDPDGPDNSGIASPPTGYTEVQPENGKAPTKCGGVVQLSHIPNSTVFKMLPVRGVLTGAHSAQDYVYKTAHKTQAGGVLNVAGDLSDLGATGGGSDKWSQTIEWPYSKLGNDTTWALKVQWDFEKWQEWCTGLAGVPGGALKMDATQTLPWDVAGGSTHLATPMAVACNDTHPLDGLTKLSTSHTENFGGWFSIAGISLDTKTTQSTSTITTIRPDNTTAAGANERDPVYCSTAATMAGSAWIREKS